MDMKAECPVCLKTIEVSGPRVECPHCHTLLEVSSPMYQIDWNTALQIGILTFTPVIMDVLVSTYARPKKPRAEDIKRSSTIGHVVGVFTAFLLTGAYAGAFRLTPVRVGVNECPE